MTDTLQRLTTALADRYRVEKELGAGGMATVYLAHDLRHERDVAIKVLHPDLGAALGADRFLAEIKTTAKLQHPHILPLLDSGAADGLLYYVMPYVRGETLRGRLERERQLAIPDALQIAREVADALHAAHALGVVHRDIKPENILLQDGHALVADFGIALAVQQAGGQRMTQTGLSLGTPQYMSPEQAMGERAVDARSDIYALGAVTYEMLAGEPPFSGASVQAIVAKVLSERPVSLHTIRDTVSPSLNTAVQQALAKLPADRFATAQLFAAALVQSADDSDPPELRAGARGRRGLSVTTIGLVALLSASLGGVGAWWAFGGESTTHGTERTSTFALDGLSGSALQNRMLALTPDGSTLVAVGKGGIGGDQLVVRRMQSLEFTRIPRTAGAFDPTISPDGKSVAFIINRTIYRAPLTGGEPVQLASLPFDPYGLAWSADGEIIAGAASKRTLTLVNDANGSVRELAAAPAGTVATWPLVSGAPGEVFFSALTTATDSVRVHALDLKTGAVTEVGTDAYMVLGVIRDRLVYLDRTGGVLAAPYSSRSHHVTGRGVRVAGGVFINPSGLGLGQAVLARSGDLVYRDTREAALLMVRDAEGRISQAVPDTSAFEHPRFSPDGRRLAVTMLDPTTRQRGIAVLNRSTGALTRVGSASADVGNDRVEWTPDGRFLLYRVIGKTSRVAAIHAADGTGADTVVSPKGIRVYEIVMANDAKTLLARIDLNGEPLFRWWTRADSTLRPLFEVNPFNNVGPRFSPDGRFVAYTAPDESSLNHVYVTAFPGPAAKVRIDRDGGGPPVWSRDGKTLYYYAPTGLVATTLTGFAPVMAGAHRQLLGPDESSFGFSHASFDVAPDGTVAFVRGLSAGRVIVVRQFADLLDESGSGRADGGRR
jgi:serine/threonine-protein kinase